MDCATGLEAVPEDPINELDFRNQGTVTVTWNPFETYVDYRGEYETTDADPMGIVIAWSAHEPPDFDGKGSDRFEADGSLVLEEMWLGSAQQPQGLSGCGHRFERIDKGVDGADWLRVRSPSSSGRVRRARGPSASRLGMRRDACRATLLLGVAP